MRNRLFLFFSLIAVGVMGSATEASRSPMHQVGILVGVPFFDETSQSFAGDMGRLTGVQAARIAHKILQRTPPGDIPVESAETFFEIDLDALDRLGLTPPAGLISQADALIR